MIVGEAEVYIIFGMLLLSILTVMWIQRLTGGVDEE